MAIKSFCLDSFWDNRLFKYPNEFNFSMSSFKQFAFLSENDNVIEIKIKEIFDTDYHNYVWPCAKIFCDYLCRNSSKFVGKTLLELGTGTGVCGIVAAKLGGRVILTDKDEESLKLAKENAEINGVHIATTPLKWGDPDWRNDYDAPNVIISSDCFYDENNIEDILYTVWSLVENGGEFYYAYQVRYDTFSIDGYLRQFNLKKELQQFESFFSDDIKEQIQIFKITSS